MWNYKGVTALTILEGVAIFVWILLPHRNFPVMVLHINMFNRVEASDTRWSGGRIDWEMDRRDDSVTGVFWNLVGNYPVL